METPASFIEAHVTRVAPLMREEALEEWEAAATGRPEHDEKVAAVRAKLMRIYADPVVFARLREWRDAAGPADPDLARQIKLLADSFAKGQQDEAIIDQLTRLQKEAEATFNTFRGSFEGAPRSDNELAQVLTTETRSDRLKAAWETSKQIGPVVSGKVLELARLRNLAAQRSGFANHFSKNLELNEIDETRLFEVLDELERLTLAPFRQAKGELDRLLADRYGVSVADLRPWHYHDPFFQRPPRVGAVNVDTFFENRSLEEFAMRTFDGIGMNVREVLGRSDLYARPC